MTNVDQNLTRYSVDYGQRTIVFVLVYRPRKTMAIAVHPDRTVVVTAPDLTDIGLIKEKVRRRAPWILRQMTYFEQFSPKVPSRSYINGETHLYLGKRYRLKLEESEKVSVKLLGPFLRVAGPGISDPKLVKQYLYRWYLEKATDQFEASLQRCWTKMSGYQVMQPRIAIKPMKTRWGSLSKRGTLTLNLNLVKASKSAIDYVVTHELCHLIQDDHSPKFYRLLSTVLPGWEEMKLKLETGFM